VTERPRSSISTLHKKWAKLEDEHHQLAIAINEARTAGTDELDLACDIAYYGPSDYPMIARLLRALVGAVPGFEFNSLRRWLSLPGQFEQLMGSATPIIPVEEATSPTEQLGFGEP